MPALDEYESEDSSQSCPLHNWTEGLPVSVGSLLSSMGTECALVLDEFSNPVHLGDIQGHVGLYVEIVLENSDAFAVFMQSTHLHGLYVLPVQNAVCT